MEKLNKRKVIVNKPFDYELLSITYTLQCITIHRAAHAASTYDN